MSVARTFEPLPDVQAYARLSEAELFERIAAAKEALGDRLVILGHHYQRDAVIQFADFQGDSLQLSRQAAATDAEYIVFCGVHFMAETAAMLARPGQQVILPDRTAGCSMVDMAPGPMVQAAWAELEGLGGADRFLPIAYVNSDAVTKALVGRAGGAICTSSNAERVLAWGLEQGKTVFFIPDENLGWNVARRLGVAPEEIVRWDPLLPLGGRTEAELARARLILWQGHCSVHVQFTAAQVAYWREKVPGIQVVVHPECRPEVVEAADAVGSTRFIVETVTDAPPGSAFAIGTEINLVNRLKDRFPDRFVAPLSPFPCQCETMYRIDPHELAWALERLVQGRPANVIRVDPETTRWALVALERMLSL